MSKLALSITNAEISSSAAIARSKLANVDLVDDSSPQLGGALDTNGSNINFGDSSTTNQSLNRLRFGTATNGDLQIYHDTNNSYIVDKGTGELRIRGAESVKIQDSDSAEDMAIFNKNGSVELYHDNSKKFETYSNGVKATGNILTTTGDISCSSDSQKITAGAGDDLQIYHDGNNSLIQNSTGYLGIQSDTLYLQDKTNGHAMITGVADGAVGLRYDNVEKLATSSTGVSVTGALVASGDVTAFSDQTLKKDITTINDALGLCGKLRGVSYKWIKDDKPSIGVIAQEIEQHIPEVVTTTQLDGKDVKSVDYGKIVGVLINAVNELKAELDEYKDKYKELTTKDYSDLTEDQRNELTFLVKKES